MPAQSQRRTGNRRKWTDCRGASRTAKWPLSKRAPETAEHQNKQLRAHPTRPANLGPAAWQSPNHQAETGLEEDGRGGEGRGGEKNTTYPATENLAGSRRRNKRTAENFYSSFRSLTYPPPPPPPPPPCSRTPECQTRVWEGMSVAGLPLRRRGGGGGGGGGGPSLTRPRRDSAGREKKDKRKGSCG